MPSHCRRSQWICWAECRLNLWREIFAPGGQGSLVLEWEFSSNACAGSRLCMVESLPSKEANQFFGGSLCPSGKQAAYFLPLILVANDRRATISTYKQPLFKAASATPVCSGLCFGLVFFGLFRLFALLLRPLHVISLATHTQLLTGKSFFFAGTLEWSSFNATAPQRSCSSMSWSKKPIVDVIGLFFCR